MTTNTQKESQVALVVDRALYEALNTADCDLHLDIDKVRSVAHVCSALWELDVSSSYHDAEYFEHPVRREEFLKTFHSLISSCGAIVDLLDAVEKSADFLTEFCCQAKEVQSLEEVEVS